MSSPFQKPESRTRENWPRRIALSLAVVTALVVVYATIYQWGMVTYEGQSVPFSQAIQKVVESFTTAGFGGHAPWESAQMSLFVVVMNLTGVLLVFLALPVFAIPLFRKALDTRPPTESDLTDHVVICSYSTQDEVLRSELENAGIPSLYVDSDPDLVTDLIDADIEAMYGDPGRVETLRAANTENARALVADVDDETNPTVILSADRVDSDLPIVSVVQEHAAAEHHRYAGADEVVEAQRVLGESLAMRAMETLSERFRESIGTETDIEITEYLIEEDSDLVGQTLAEADVFDRSDVTVIGGWFGGKLLVAPDASTTITENTILLVVGQFDVPEDVTGRELPSHDDHPSRVVVCGYGAVGRPAADRLTEAGFDVEVIDTRRGDGVDIAGDITDPETFSSAAIRDSRAVVLAVDDDAQAIYAAITIDQIAPDVEIIARANDQENVWKLYNAGADYVLSLPMVTGETLASTLIDEQTILTPQHEFEFARVEAPAIAGRSFGEADIRARTGCTIIAVERDDRVLTDVGADFVVEDGDVLVAIGSVEDAEQFVDFVGRGER